MPACRAALRSPICAWVATAPTASRAVVPEKERSDLVSSKCTAGVLSGVLLAAARIDTIEIMRGW